MEFGYEAMKAHIRQQDIDSVERAIPHVPALNGIKFVHFGYPLGRIVPAPVAEETAQSLYQDESIIPFRSENRSENNDTCIVMYLKELMQETLALSCGKCVLCREGLRQLNSIFDSISRGSANTERLSFAQEVAHAMSIGCDCDFGKGAGRMVELALTDFQEEISDHIRRRRCPALACVAFYTVHILPEKCTGCGDCIDECPEEAIEGKSKFIHMIDNDVCERCGKCIEVCPEGAIVKAGPVKPRTPVRLTRVGTFRTNASRSDEDD